MTGFSPPLGANGCQKLAFWVPKGDQKVTKNGLFAKVGKVDLDKNTILFLGSDPSKKHQKTCKNAFKNRDAFNSGILTTKVRQLGARAPPWVLLGTILGSLGAPFRA